MMRAAAAKAAPTVSPAPIRSFNRLLQRKCACANHGGSQQCEECSENKLQRKAVGGFDPKRAPAIVDDVLRAPGAPLDQRARAFMEERFAHSLGDVRVHTGADAARSARAVNAHAYRVGCDIVFAGGRYAPDTAHGKQLLAHELTHVVQQRGVTAASPGGGLKVDTSQNAGEQEAERISATIAADHSFAGAAGANRARLRQPAPIVSRLNAGAPDAVPLTMNFRRTAHTGLQFVPTDVRDTKVGPVSIQGGLLDGGASRLHTLAVELLPLWTTATPFTPPGAATPLPLDLVTADQLARRFWFTIRPLPSMNNWRAGLRLPLPVEIDDATHMATLNPQQIIALAGAFDPAWAPLLDQHAATNAAPSPALLLVEVDAFLHEHADATDRGITLGARALTNASAELPFIREVFRELSATEAASAATAFLDNFVQRELQFLAAQRDGSAIPTLFETALNSAPAGLNSVQRSRLQVLSDAINNTPAVAPPGAARSRAEKTVTIDTVKLDGLNRDPAADIATADGVFAACNVRLIPGVNAVAPPADSTAWIGADLKLQEGNCGAASAEERRMIRGATTRFGLTARIRAFYVPVLSSRNRADSCPPAGAIPLLSRSAYVSNDAMGRSLAHEIGHILLNPGPHRRVATKIMTPTNAAPLGERSTVSSTARIYNNA